MQNNGPLPMLVAGSLVVAVLCTLLVKSGWLIGMRQGELRAQVQSIDARSDWSAGKCEKTSLAERTEFVIEDDLQPTSYSSFFFLRRLRLTFGNTAKAPTCPVV